MCRRLGSGIGVIVRIMGLLLLLWLMLVGVRQARLLVRRRRALLLRALLQDRRARLPLLRRMKTVTTIGKVLMMMNCEFATNEATMQVDGSLEVDRHAHCHLCRSCHLNRRPRPGAPLLSPPSRCSDGTIQLWHHPPFSANPFGYSTAFSPSTQQTAQRPNQQDQPAQGQREGQNDRQ